MKKLPSRGAKGLRRSLHFVPGGNDRMFEKALKLPADSLILDLEDSVTPSNKKAARDEVCNWIKEIDFENQECLVRINPLDTSWGLDDLQAVAEALPDGIVLPKVAKKKDVTKIDSIVGDVELAICYRCSGAWGGTGVGSAARCRTVSISRWDCVW